MAEFASAPCAQYSAVSDSCHRIWVTKWSRCKGTLLEEQTRINTEFLSVLAVEILSKLSMLLTFFDRVLIGRSG